jgi:hypothetical protein
MPAWIQLTSEKLRSFYRVPVTAIATDNNAFYGAEHHPRDADGPWPLLAFLQAKGQPAVITFQIYTIEAEELASETFNPLAQPRGYLSLDRKELIELVGLLLSRAAMLAPGPKEVPQMFRQIEDFRLGDFGLHPEWFPDSKEQYYYQIYDPLEGSDIKSDHTVLIFSAGQSSQFSSRLYFKVAHFSQQALVKASFDILDDSLPMINLDRSGMEELARLLERQLVNLAS